MDLKIDEATDTVIVPHGITFADLFAAWEKQRAYVLHLIGPCDKPNETEEEEARCRSEIAMLHLLQQAIYEASAAIKTTDELVMLARVDLTFRHCVHDYPQHLPEAIIRILGKPTVQAAQALFDGPVSQQVGIRTGL